MGSNFNQFWRQLKERRSINTKQGSHFSLATKFHDFSMTFQGFSQISRYNFPHFHMAYTPFDSPIPLVGGGSHLKSTEPWFREILEKSSQTPNTLVGV